MAGQTQQRHSTAIDLEAGNDSQVNYRQTPEVAWIRNRLSAYFSKANAAINLLLPVMFIGKMRYHRHAMTSVSAVAFGIAFLVSFLLNCFGLISSGSGEPLHVHLLCNIAYVLAMLRMFAAFALLLFYKVLWYVVIFPLLLFLGLLVCVLKKTFDAAPRKMEGVAHIIGAKHYWEDAHGTQLEFLFDLSAEAVFMGFSGLYGSVHGYVKNSLDLTRGHKSPECFLFYGTTIGLLVELLATVPPAAYLKGIRSRIVEVYLRFLAYAAVLFLLMACLAAAEAILHELILLAFLADVIVVVLCFCKNHRDDETHLRWLENRSDEERKADLESCRHLTGFFHAAIFPVLIASYTTYVGKVDSSGSDLISSLSWPFKLFVLAMLSSIVTYFTWIVVVLETPRLGRRAFPKKACAWATYLLMAVTAIFFVLLLVAHPDELVSIR